MSHNGISTLPSVIERMGDIHLAGDVSGRALQQVNASQQIRSGAGNATVHFALTPKQDFMGEIETTGLDLRQLLNDEQFGMLVTNIKLHGISSFTVLLPRIRRKCMPTELSVS